MWYVIQTMSGNEKKIKQLLDRMKPEGIADNCFVPLTEEVRRRADDYRILFRRLFPGYVFVETRQPEEVFQQLRRIPDFTRLLGTKEDGEAATFIPVGEDDEAFLRTLLEDGVMHVSYVHLSKSHRIDKVAGPLAGYRNHITKLEFRRRIAIVDAVMFGKKRRIYFGLWTDGDPRLPWLEKKMNEEQEAALDAGIEIDIGIRPGDRVKDESGVYGDYVFLVDKVDAKHRTVFATFQMGASSARIELDADFVRKCEG
ncbi:MAG: hypothetical protein IJP92_10140 [Lachnospiraceae bacterium]|nr:hypothetical protein [Lachnospiraceae bacterium]